MQRRLFIRNSSAVLTAIALFSNKTIAQLINDPSWTITMFNDDTGIFTEKGGTILFKLTKEGYVVVDSQFPDAAAHLMDELKKKEEQPFRLLINTHHHSESCSGNIAFKGKVQHILAHENSKFNQEVLAREKGITDKQLFPDQTYKDTWCETIGKDEICLQYFGAAHTNGDSVVHFPKEKIVHLGDLMCNRRHPFVDRNAGASISNWIGMLDKISNSFDKKTKFICGNAASGYNVIVKKEDLKLFSSYLERLLNYVEGEIKSGKSKNELLKTKEIPGETEWKGSEGIDRILSAAYQELMEARI
ncbi:MAG: MBL fold metallo-hydrolase [Ferruginibacter sp.]